MPPIKKAFFVTSESYTKQTTWPGVNGGNSQSKNDRDVVSTHLGKPSNSDNGGACALEQRILISGREQMNSRRKAVHWTGLQAQAKENRMMLEALMVA